ncbi:MAG: LysR family transcriptional regulator [Pseudomonadota bacterium]
MVKTLDRFDLLRLFLKVVETGSLTAAGAALGLSQPSASRQLRVLEDDLGAQLLSRTTHRQNLTDAGQRFLPEARALVDRWDAVRDDIQDRQADLAGPIRVLAPVGLGQSVLPEIVGPFLSRHPRISLDWILDDAPRDLVAEGIDVWLRIGRVPDESLIVRELLRIERLVVAGANFPNPATPETCSELPAVVLTPFANGLVRLFDRAQREALIVQETAVATDNLFTARGFVAAGAGYGVLPRWLVADALDDGTMRHLVPEWRPAAMPLSIAYPRGRYRPVRIDGFIDMIRSEIAVEADLFRRSPL